MGHQSADELAHLRDSLNMEMLHPATLSVLNITICALRECDEMLHERIQSMMSGAICESSDINVAICYLCDVILGVMANPGSKKRRYDDM